MKRLIFGKGLMGVTLLGEKQISIRKYREGSHDFFKDDIIRGEFVDGLNILLLVTADTEKKPFSELTNVEAQEDGFSDAEDAFNGLRSYYPDLTKEDLAGIIRFDVLSVDGEATVCINEHGL